MNKQLGTFDKARKMQDAADRLVKSYEIESTNTDAFRMAVKFRNDLHELSNASLGRLYDILMDVFV